MNYLFFHNLVVPTHPMSQVNSLSYFHFPIDTNSTNAVTSSLLFNVIYRLEK